MYGYPEPPYFLVFASLLASLASGAAFDAVLRQSVQEWSRSRSTRSIAKLQSTPLFLPFAGIAVGSCIFLASGIQIFSFPQLLAYAISIPMTLLIGTLVWVQLGKVLVQLEKGGSAALDLDDFF